MSVSASIAKFAKSIRDDYPIIDSFARRVMDFHVITSDEYVSNRGDLEAEIAYAMFNSNLMTRESLAGFKAPDHAPLKALLDKYQLSSSIMETVALHISGVATEESKGDEEKVPAPTA